MCYLKQCVSLLSLPEGAPVQHKSYSNKGAYEIGLEKLCDSGWIDQELGICHKGLKSEKKGKECDDSTECETNLKDRNARCKPALFAKDTKKYCDIEGNDDEWVAAQNAVS